MNENSKKSSVNDLSTEQQLADERIEGLDPEIGSWGDYPIDELFIRHESRTVYDVVRRIKQKRYIMDPDFQRDFIWPLDKQSKLIESVIMRIPLPVFYLAEDSDGNSIVVDGLQRFSTLNRFLNNDFSLRLLGREELNGKKFDDLPVKLQNRIEDCTLTVYILDSKTPNRARLDIFERVNSGEPLTRQQMRNCLFMGKATRFLRKESTTDIFSKATGQSLNVKKMRDREFINRFCAFQLLSHENYRGDMDEFLAEVLTKMNRMQQSEISELSKKFHTGLRNNFVLFGSHAFRKHIPNQEYRNVLNASLWDVMSTCLSHHSESEIKAKAGPIRRVFYDLLENDDFVDAISIGTNGTRKVKRRFAMTREKLGKILNADTN